MRNRLATLAGVGALVLLTGCGSDLGPDMHPGTAATVGDHTVSIDEVDDLSSEVCGFYARVFQSPGSMSAVRSQVLDAKIAEIKAREFAEEFDVDPRPIIRSQTAATEKQLSELDLSGEQETAYRELIDSYVYVSAVNVAVGQEAGAASGKQVDLQTAVQQGGQIVNDWTGRLEVESDPRFAVSAEDGVALDPAPLSVAVSDQAVQAGDQEAMEAHLATLPASQKCE